MSEVTITLPHTLNTHTLRSIVSKFYADCNAFLPDEVLVDFARLGFIEPAGVTFLSNFINWLHHNNTVCSFLNHLRQAPCLDFLDDSLFFEQHLGQKLNPFRNPRSTTQHLRRVGHDESHSFIRGTLSPWLASAMKTNNASIHPFQVCLSEIFNNIQDHTDRENGSIFAQHFPNKKRVKIAIADFGQGIPKNVAKIIDGLSDNDCIVKAVEAGFSSRSTPTNRGAGLDFLLQTVVGTNGGEVTISSQSGNVRFLPATDGIRVFPSNSTGHCPGTTIDIILRTDQVIVVEDGPEDLEW